MIEDAVLDIPGVRSAFVEWVTGGYFVDFDVRLSWRYLLTNSANIIAVVRVSASLSSFILLF